MVNAQQLRAQIESQLANRIPSALTPAPRLIRETIPTGIPSVDELLGGGVPLGAITEVIGGPSSGRTTFAMSLLAHVSQSGHVCAWIDAANEFDAVSAASIGIALPQLLLVRCGIRPQQATTAKLPSKTVTPAAHEASTSRTSGGGSPHPRSEIRGLGNAVGELFQSKIADRAPTVGSPSANNIRLGKVVRDEQVNSDRLPSRRANPGTKQITIPASNPDRSLPVAMTHSSESTWKRIEQAVKVVDLLLQNGGFRAIVIDFASFAPTYVSRIPLATWFRFRTLAESTHASLLLLTQHPCAKSSTELSMQLACVRVVDQSKVMTGVTYKASILRQRYKSTTTPITPLRKPPQATHAADWHSPSAWVGLHG
jgi:recombination protein RecA